MVYEFMFRLFGGLTLALVLLMAAPGSQARADPGTDDGTQVTGLYTCTANCDCSGKSDGDPCYNPLLGDCAKKCYCTEVVGLTCVPNTETTTD
jgi:hypothetical protein